VDSYLVVLTAAIVSILTLMTSGISLRKHDERNDQEHMSVKTPYGTFSLHGQNIIGFLILIGLVSLAYFTVTKLDDLRVSIEVQSYILSLDPASRPRLRVPQAILDRLPKEEQWEYYKQLQQERRRDDQERKIENKGERD
jgi:hypothetical protein